MVQRKFVCPICGLFEGIPFLRRERVPVLSPPEAKRANVDRVVVMKPNYLDEIRSLCREIGFAPDFITL